MWGFNHWQRLSCVAIRLQNSGSKFRVQSRLGLRHARQKPLLTRVCGEPLHCYTTTTTHLFPTPGALSDFDSVAEKGAEPGERIAHRHDVLLQPLIGASSHFKVWILG